MAPPQKNVGPSSAADEDDDPCLQALLCSKSHVFPMVLNAATQLGVFDIMARAGGGGDTAEAAWVGAQLSASEIAAQLDDAARSGADTVLKLDRMLRLLASHSLLSCSVREVGGDKVERLYGLTPASRFFLKQEEGNEEEDSISLASVLALSLHPAPMQVWFGLKDSILEGGSQFKKVHGMSIFEYMDVNPEFNDVFNKAMAALTKLIMSKVLRVYRGFEGLTTLMDVAGGTGKCLHMIVTKYPSVKGVNFDLPHVVQTAPSYPGIEHVGGSMLSSVPKAEAIMIKDTLHNWNDENCVKILKNCYEALPSRGKVVVIDTVMPEAPETSMPSKYVSMLDNTMLLQPGGQERTEREFKSLCKDAGFSDFKFVCAAYSLWAVMEFYK